MFYRIFLPRRGYRLVAIEFEKLILPCRGKTSVGDERLWVFWNFVRSLEVDLTLASGDAKHIAFKSGDLNERMGDDLTLASGDAKHIAFKSGDLNEQRDQLKNTICCYNLNNQYENECNHR